LGGDRFCYHLGHFVGRRPYIAQIHGLAVASPAQWLALDIEIHRARQRVCDHQRRRRGGGETHHGGGPTFQISIAPLGCARDQIPPLDRGSDTFFDWAAVADASGTSVADEVELELLQVFEEPRTLEVASHHS